MKTIAKLCVFAISVTTVVVLGVGTAYAGVPQNSTVVLPEVGGPIVPGLTPGVEGYKVFGPGAFLVENPYVDDTLGALSILDTPTWSASTNVYRGSPTSINGSHFSESTEYCQQIWVDGGLQLRGAGYWADFQSLHSSGWVAGVNTSMYWYAYTWYHGQSWHFFHEDGYVEWSPQTSQDFQTYGQ